MVSMQVGVRRETPNPNIIRRRVGVRCAHPNLQGYIDFETSSIYFLAGCDFSGGLAADFGSMTW
jgi:hypothetical protein